MAADQISNALWPRCFAGDGSGQRHLERKRSGIKVRRVDAGWEWRHLPEATTQRRALDTVVQGHPGYQSGQYAVPQSRGCDTEDRIALGAKLLRELLAAGLGMSSSLQLKR